uniref:Protein-lysine N-trimethyltransferase SMYD5 n=1 Tax=Oncorhynchus tshawytscha TaxID=74940 RepID=A0A8C8M1M2_ONCTS
MAASQDVMLSFCVDTTKVCNCVEVRFIDKVKGKGLFAKKAIKKGDTIFVERPLVSSQFLWNSQYKYKACEYCLSALETAQDNARRLSGNPGLSLPHTELCKVRPELHQACPQCQVMYCSNECRQAAADQYHRALCLGCLETSSIMLMARMVATVKQAQDKYCWQKLFFQLCSRAANEEEEIAHKLLGEKFQGFRSLFALVGTNGQGIGTSSLSQWVQACDALELTSQQREQLDSFIDQLYKDIEKETGDFLNCEGSGLFLLQSSCNHSCIPKAEASFPNNNFLLHLSALSDISPGEEICISYLDCCQRDRSCHSRQKLLRENYLFVCSCPKCVSQMDELDLTSSEEEEEEEEDDMEEEITDV